MSETFTKLFHSIIASSIWQEDDATRLVWITMLALSDRYGYVGASIPGLASMANVTTESAATAVAKFLKPDPWSRSQEFEGRRIEVADRGWNILNYPRFRDMRDEEARKEYERDRKRRSRANKCPGQSHDVPQCPHPSANSDVDSEEEEAAALLSSKGLFAASRPKRFALAKHLRAEGITIAEVDAVLAICAKQTKKGTGIGMAVDVLKQPAPVVRFFIEDANRVAFTSHVPNLPLGSASCGCKECHDFRRKSR